MGERDVLVVVGDLVVFIFGIFGKGFKFVVMWLDVRFGKIIVVGSRLGV